MSSNQCYHYSEQVRRDNFENLKWKNLIDLFAFHLIRIYIGQSLDLKRKSFKTLFSLILVD